MPGANIPIDGVSVWMALDSDSLDHPNLNFQIDQRFQAQLFGRDLVVNFNAHNFQFDAHGKLLTTNPPVAAGDGANTDANPASGNLRLDIDAVYQLTSVFRIGIADTNAHESSNDTSLAAAAGSGSTTASGLSDLGQDSSEFLLRRELPIWWICWSIATIS